MSLDRLINPTRRQLLQASAAAALVGAGPRAQAQAWPGRPITLVNPYPAGGGLDPVARLMALELGKRLGTPMVVENRTGAAGMVGAAAVVKAKPDGFTLLIGTASEIVINQHLFDKVAFDSQKDLLPISMVVRLPFVLVAHPSLPANNVRELLDYSRKNPGKLSYASAGNGSLQHLSGELFKSMSNTFMVHIPYRGVAPAVADLVAGQLPLAFAGLPTVLPHIRAGRLKALGMTSAARVPQAPEIATIAEQGLAGFQVMQWFAMFAPAATPPEIVERLQREVANVLNHPEIRANLSAQGAEPSPSSAQALADFVKLESAQYGRLIKSAKIKGDA